MQNRPTKPCAVCGREMQWRKKWAKSWEAVKYCSDRCRRSGTRDVDGRIEREIVTLLDQRDASSSICPSEVARAVAGEKEDWRALMEKVRQAARRMAAKGLLDITQSGRRVRDPSEIKGPIRLARPK